MTNKKKNLIEALHGSYMFVANLPELIDKETIYDKPGMSIPNFWKQSLRLCRKWLQSQTM